MNIKIFAAGAAITLIIASTALAHKGATGMVKMRMDAMSAIGDNMKSISAMLTGKAPFDGALVSELLSNLVSKRSSCGGLMVV